ncbi:MULTISPECIES: RcnB family protein [unclassified Brevundimonas]|nr:MULTISPECIES: RcnB family protein [unclassified Brevundimonas]
MRKTLTAAIAAVMAAGALGAAGAASAQPMPPHGPHGPAARHGPGPDHRDFRREQRHERRDFRHEQRRERHAYREEQRAYARWQQAQRRYHAPRYVPPRGYEVRSWRYGQRMPSYYRTNDYVVRDYGRYGLRAPPHGYQYVRSGNDVVLAAVAGGLITAVIAGLFN